MGMGGREFAHFCFLLRDLGKTLSSLCLSFFIYKMELLSTPCMPQTAIWALNEIITVNMLWELYGARQIHRAHSLGSCKQSCWVLSWETESRFWDVFWGISSLNFCWCLFFRGFAINIFCFEYLAMKNALKNTSRQGDALSVWHSHWKGTIRFCFQAWNSEHFVAKWRLLLHLIPCHQLMLSSGSVNFNIMLCKNRTLWSFLYKCGGITNLSGSIWRDNDF